MISESEKQDIATAYFQDGKEEGKVEVAKSMLADKFPIETIAKHTKLTVDQIKAL